MKYVIGLLVVLLAVSVAFAYQAQGRYREQAFRSDSLQAAADTARELHLATLDDSVRAYERRVFQIELERDSLDEELERRPVVRVYAGIRIDTLHVTDTVPAVVQEDTVDTYTFSGQDGPFTIGGLARIFPDRHGVFDLAVAQVEPIDVEVRLQCADGDGGVNTAHAVLLARDPFSLVPTRIDQGREVCNPSRPFLAFGASVKTVALTVTGSIAVWEGLKRLLRR